MGQFVLVQHMCRDTMLVGGDGRNSSRLDLFRDDECVTIPGSEICIIRWKVVFGSKPAQVVAISTGWS